MYNQYNIKTVRIQNNLIASYYMHYDNEQVTMHCAVSAQLITQYIEPISFDEYKTVDAQQVISRAVYALEALNPKLFKKIMNTEQPSLMCAYDFVVYNDDQTPADFVSEGILKTALNIEENKIKEIVNEIHNTPLFEPIHVKTFNTYEMAHCALVLSRMFNESAGQNFRVDIQQNLKSQPTYKALYEYLRDEQLI